MTYVFLALKIIVEFIDLHAKLSYINRWGRLKLVSKQRVINSIHDLMKFLKKFKLMLPSLNSFARSNNPKLWNQSVRLLVLICSGLSSDLHHYERFAPVNHLEI